jgi:ketosteroid isomerase-like protein
MNLDESTKKAFDLASDSTKQLITLSTGILALTITFGKDVYQGFPTATKDILMDAWIGYLVSIVFGIFVLFALTGTVEPKRRAAARGAAAGTGEPDAGADASGGPGAGTPPGGAEAAAGPAQQSPTIWTGSVRVFSALQIIAFLFATIYVFRVGAATLSNSNASSNTSMNLSPAVIEQLIGEKHRVLLEAMLRKDAAAIEQNLSNDCVIMGSIGQVLNRSQLLADIKSGDLSYESVTTDDVSVHIYGDTAVETGHGVVKGKYKDQDLSGEFRYSIVFVKRQDSWQAISIQVARVNQPMTSNHGGKRRRRRARTSARGYSRRRR